MARFRVSECDTELDLRQTKDHKFRLSVPDDTFIRVTLYSPCRVRVSQAGDATNAVNVTGCELQIGTSGRWKGGQLRSVDGRPPFMLTAEVAERGELSVQGGP